MTKVLAVNNLGERQFFSRTCLKWIREHFDGLIDRGGKSYFRFIIWFDPIFPISEDMVDCCDWLYSAMENHISVKMGSVWFWFLGEGMDLNEPRFFKTLVLKEEAYWFWVTVFFFFYK